MNRYEGAQVRGGVVAEYHLFVAVEFRMCKNIHADVPLARCWLWAWHDNPLARAAHRQRWRIKGAGSERLMYTALSALLLTVAATGGVAVASRHLRGVPVPLGLGLAHGVAASLGVLALTLAAVTGGNELRVNMALGCFVLALIGGAFNLLFRLEGDKAPGFMIALHAFAAVVGLILLWLTVLGW